MYASCKAACQDYDLSNSQKFPSLAGSVSLLILGLSGKTVSTAAVNYFYGGVRIGEEEKANSRIWNRYAERR